MNEMSKQEERYSKEQLMKGNDLGRKVFGKAVRSQSTEASRLPRWSNEGRVWLLRNGKRLCLQK
jgi:hypothetical protein